MNNRLISGSLDINVLLAFIFGLIFISVMLLFAVKYPNPGNFAQWVFIIVTSLAGAGIGAVIPGLLHVKLPYVKAGGALAVFVIVLLNKPTIVDAIGKFIPPPDSPLPTALEYIQKSDSGLFEQAWDSLDGAAKETIARDKAAYLESYRNGRVPLGAVVSRAQIGTNELVSPQGYPSGIYRIILFRTTFASGDCRLEDVSLRAAEDIKWRVYGHTVGVLPVPCV